jgi:ATPase subunit of ABC transporter with duplicated ATPase domains
VDVIKSLSFSSALFSFPKTASQWGEPLIVAYDIGYGFDKDALQRQEGPAVEESTFVDDDGILRFIKRDGFLFDCVNLCIEEGSINCLLGPDNYSSCLLQILAKRLVPVEGTVYQPPGVRVGYCSYHVVREIVFHTESSTTALVHLLKSYPKKNEKEIRGHLSQFGLSPTSQEKTPLCFLSGGEAFRFALAALMLEDPPVICIENPTASLDVESVQALAFGLQNWNGTVVMTSVDAFFLRALENLRCFVISESDGKLRRLPPEMQGIDGYLKKVHLDD